MEDFYKRVLKPRTATKHINRVNYSTDSVEGYFGVAVYNPFLDFIIMFINVRFTEDIINEEEIKKQILK